MDCYACLYKQIVCTHFMSVASKQMEKEQVLSYWCLNCFFIPSSLQTLLLLHTTTSLRHHPHPPLSWGEWAWVQLCVAAGLRDGPVYRKVPGVGRVREDPLRDHLRLCQTGGQLRTHLPALSADQGRHVQMCMCVSVHVCFLANLQITECYAIFHDCVCVCLSQSLFMLVCVCICASLCYLN